MPPPPIIRTHRPNGSAVPSKMAAQKMQPKSSLTNRTQLQSHTNLGGGGGSGSSSSRGSGPGDALEKRIQDSLNKLRSDRDKERRALNVAHQRFQAAEQEIGQLEKSVADEKRKLNRTTKQSERTERELKMMELSVENLERKFNFQHQDLIHKRAKIQKQKEELKTAEEERAETLTRARTLLAEQRAHVKAVDEKRAHKFIFALNDAIETSPKDLELVDVELEDLFDNEKDDDNNKKNSPNAEKKKARQAKLDEELATDLILMKDDDWMRKIIVQKAERLETETTMIRGEIFRMEAKLDSHGFYSNDTDDAGTNHDKMDVEEAEKNDHATKNIETNDTLVIETADSAHGNEKGDDTNINVGEKDNEIEGPTADFAENGEYEASPPSQPKDIVDVSIGNSHLDEAMMEGQIGDRRIIRQAEGDAMAILANAAVGVEQVDVATDSLKMIEEENDDDDNSMWEERDEKQEA